MEWYDSLLEDTVNENNSDLILQGMIENLESNNQSDQDDWQLPPLDYENGIVANSNRPRPGIKNSCSADKENKQISDSPILSASSACQNDNTENILSVDGYNIGNENKKYVDSQPAKLKLRMCSTCNCRYATGLKKNNVPYKTCSVCAHRKRRQYLKKKYY